MHKKWIWQQKGWPKLFWQDSLLLPVLRTLRFKMGCLVGASSVLSCNPNELAMDMLVANITHSSAIENERLDVPSVRSALSRRMGIACDTRNPALLRAEKLVEMQWEALNYNAPLTLGMLLQWHRCLFPVEDERTAWISPGQLRGPGVMQVVSGNRDNPIIHFEAPPHEILNNQLEEFIQWFNDSVTDVSLDPLLRAGVAHLWFVVLHPFQDGNGRLTRAITDMALAQACPQSRLLYAMSFTIFERRTEYYQALQTQECGGLDITEWLLWFLYTLTISIEQSQQTINHPLVKKRFWIQHQAQNLRPEQIKILDLLLSAEPQEFMKGISASQYQIFTNVSRATASRHLAELQACGCLTRGSGRGRSTRYHLKMGVILNTGMAIAGDEELPVREGL